MEDLNPYIQILDRYDISDLLQHSKIDFESYLMENITNIIYYSSKMEGNNLDEDTSNLILNGILAPKNGTLQDYIEISNHGKAYEKLVRMSKNEITLNDVIDLRKTLLDNIIGDGKYNGFRRFRLVSEFNKGTAEQVPGELQKFLSILNTKPDNTIDAFLNAVRFHALFEELHPFEDGNGRVGRLLMNLYMMKNRLAPILITQEDKDIYISGLRSHHAGYYGGLIYHMLFLSLGIGGREKLLNRLENTNEKDPIEIEFRDIILSLQKEASEKKIEKIKSDVLWLYSLKDRNKNLALAALHIAGLNKIDASIISDALSDAESDIRALAIETAWEVWSEKYIPYFVEISLNDKYYMNRARALLTLSLKGAIDSKLLSKILAQENDETVLSLFFSKIAYSKKVNSLITNIDLIKKKLESESKSLKSAAYYVLMKYGTDQDIVEATQKLVKSKDLLVIEKSLFSLFWFNKIDLDQIAEIVINLSKENKAVRDTMLGLFDKFSKYKNFKINIKYNDFLEGIIRYEADNTEKAYAYYILGKIRGYDYLSNKYGLEISKKNSAVENISLMLTKAPENRINDVVELLNLSDNRLTTVGAVELNRLLNIKEFNSNFLALCSRELSYWH